MPSDIKQAAAALFRQSGADFTLDQLQQLTGISRATLYRRIGSKQALISQLAIENLIELDPQADIDSRIFTATRNIVADHGFIASTMEQIANEAGLGVATLYRHFGDKENLLRCFIAQIKPMQAIKSVLVNDNGNIDDDLKRVVDIALSFFKENMDLVKIIFSWQSAERAYLNEIREKSSSTHHQITRYMAAQQTSGTLRADLSPEDLALNFTGLLLQYALHAPAHINRPLNITQDSKTIVKLFLDGARNTDR
jgi:AcrR family transcriptional regulator